MVEPGNHIGYLAFGADRRDHDLLPQKAINQWDLIRGEFNTRWKGSKDPLARRRIVDLSGCLEKLEATMLQAHRLRLYHDRLISLAHNHLGNQSHAVALQGSDACADFEGFLLHGRASLDRLTWFIGDCFKNRVKSFRRIKGVLSNFEHKDSKAKELLFLVSSADDWFDGTFGKLQSSQSLRDIVAHHHSLVEGTRTCFGVQLITQNSALLIDCEIELPGLSDRFPILKTTHQSIRYVAFLILNSVAVFLDIERLSLEEYQTTWTNHSVAVSDYVMAEPAGSPLGKNTLSTVRRMTPDGFEYGIDNVDPSIFTHQFPLQTHAP